MEYNNSNSSFQSNDYKMLFDNMTQGFAIHEIILDENGKPYNYKFIDINPAFENLTGLFKNDITGKTIIEVLPDAEYFWIETYGKVALTGEPIRFESYSRTLDKYYDIWAFSPEKGIFATVFYDITNSKKMEKSITESEKRLRSYIDYSPYGIIVTNKAGEILNLNETACKVIGFEKSALIGEEILKLIPANYVKQVEKYFDDLNPMESSDIVIPILHMNYEERFVSISARQINEDEFISFIKDITEKHEFDIALKYSFFHDSLTNLYNRKYIFEYLNEIDNEKNYPLSIALADINGLRSVNDAFGFGVGDEVIRRVASAIKKSSDDDFILARWSGDSFLIILPNKDHDFVENYVHKINNIVAEHSTNDGFVSVSFGIATKTDINVEFVKLIRKAESHLITNKSFESKSLHNNSINMILQTLHEKSNREETHSKRVSDICIAIGEAMNFTITDINKLRTIGLVHDIGKIGINDSILNKPAKLSKNECNKVKEHCEIGYRILSSNQHTAELAFYVLSHHEKLDGTGYPNGIKDENISIFTRILSIAESYDAMRSKKNYCDAISSEQAINELLSNSGSQFDAAVVSVFINKVVDKYEATGIY